MTLGSGEDAGKSYDFEQAEVKLGRVQANDVVVHDPSVSRRHARIITKQGAYLIEDLGSTQGTRVNQEAVKSPRPLRDGDVVLLGDVVFRVGILRPAADPNAKTRIVDPVQVGRPPPGRALGDEVEPTAPVKKVSPRPLAPRTEKELEAAGDTPVAKTALDLEPLKASDVETEERPQLARPERPGRVRPSLSVADRARHRREAQKTLGGRLKLLWEDLSQPQRIAAVGGAGVLAVAALVAVLLGMRSDTATTAAEPEKLTGRPIPDSFGLGDGVKWSRPDMKVFTFQFVSATRAVAILHYQAQEVSEGEVTVTMNGVEVGTVPPDTTEVYEREIQLVLPPKLLKRDAPNQILFDNVRNPPGTETWRIWNLWVEVLPIPELPNDELIAQAEDYAKRGKEFLDLQAVGAENLFKSWKSYRNAWITLVGLEPKPELYEIARVQMLSLAKQLDQQCARMMLEVQRQMQFKNRKKARQTLEDVGRYFPTGEHRCHNLALEKMSEYQL